MTYGEISEITTKINEGARVHEGIKEAVLGIGSAEGFAEKVAGYD